MSPFLACSINRASRAGLAVSTPGFRLFFVKLNSQEKIQTTSESFAQSQKNLGSAPRCSNSESSRSTPSAPSVSENHDGSCKYWNPIPSLVV
jgi:hypothetical protein